MCEFKDKSVHTVFVCVRVCASYIQELVQQFVSV